MKVPLSLVVYVLVKVYSSTAFGTLVVSYWLGSKQVMFLIYWLSQLEHPHFELVQTSYLEYWMFYVKLQYHCSDLIPLQHHLDQN